MLEHLAISMKGFADLLEVKILSFSPGDIAVISFIPLPFPVEMSKERSWRPTTPRNPKSSL
jgi:hypothetical protein